MSVLCYLGICVVLYAARVKGSPLSNGRLASSVTETSGLEGQGQEKDLNQICQDSDKTMVYEKVLGMCVPCFSCDPDSSDDHCVTCRALGIIPGEATASGLPTEVHPTVSEDIHGTSLGGTIGSTGGATGSYEGSTGGPQYGDPSDDEPVNTNRPRHGVVAFGLRALIAFFGTVLGASGMICLGIWAAYMFRKRRVGMELVPQQETQQKPIPPAHTHQPVTPLPLQETGTPAISPSWILTDCYAYAISHGTGHAV